MSLTRQLVERTATLGGALPEEDAAALRTLLLDHLAVTAGGSPTDSARAAQRWVLAVGADKGAPAFPVVGAGFSAAAVEAAMANAVAGHSIEYDDVHNPSSSHPGVAVFPAAMAAAAIAGADGARFVDGAVVGYEVMCRVGRALNPPAHYARHFHPTATAGAIGAAAAACRILGMDVDSTVSALGIAADSAAGSMQFIVDGAWTKRWHPALAVRNGVHAALLARSGFRGTEDGIAGERGLLRGYSEDPHPEELLAQWGERPLEITATSIKPHTTCRYNQAAVDAVLALRSAHSLRAEEVERIEVGLPGVALGIVCEPRATKVRPQSIVDAQFSLPYSVAVALLRGRAGMAEFDGSLLADATLLALADRVSAQVDAEADRNYPGRWEAEVAVTTRDGRTLRSRTLDAWGDPGNPVSPHALQAKFEELGGPLFSASRRSAIVDAVNDVHRADGPQRLAALLRPDPTAAPSGGHRAENAQPAEPTVRV
jgi:2-methylcitrate dehydratase PrpD